MGALRRRNQPRAGFYYSASKHSAGQPIVAGWSFQWISQLSFTPDSWTAPLDARRISPLEDTTTATIDQIRRLVGRLSPDGEVAMFVFDAGYDPIALAEGLDGDRVQILCRIREDRVFYSDPPPRPNRPAGTGGRPPRHGRRMKCTETETWSKPSERFVTTDARYGTVTVTAWHQMHPRLLCRGHWKQRDVPPIVKGSVIRVEVEHLPKPTARNKKTLWLFWAGPQTPDLDLAWRAYLRRFDIEHAFRFAKNTLGWTSPSLCTPAQAERWTWLVVAMLTQLRLARDDVDDLRLPWEQPRGAHQLTPARVRRGFRRLRAHLGTPASPPKHTRAGPGRPKSTKSPPRIRHPAIKRAA